MSFWGPKSWLPFVWSQIRNLECNIFLAFTHFSFVLAPCFLVGKSTKRETRYTCRYEPQPPKKSPLWERIDDLIQFPRPGNTINTVIFIAQYFQEEPGRPPWHQSTTATSRRCTASSRVFAAVGPGGGFPTDVVLAFETSKLTPTNPPTLTSNGNENTFPVNQQKLTKSVNTNVRPSCIDCLFEKRAVTSDLFSSRIFGSKKSGWWPRRFDSLIGSACGSDFGQKIEPVMQHSMLE